MRSRRWFRSVNEAQILSPCHTCQGSCQASVCTCVCTCRSIAARDIHREHHQRAMTLHTWMSSCACTSATCALTLSITVSRCALVIFDGSMFVMSAFEEDELELPPHIVSLCVYCCQQCFHALMKRKDMREQATHLLRKRRENKSVARSSFTVSRTRSL